MYWSLYLSYNQVPLIFSKMSNARGNVKKSGPPKHKNKTAFKNTLHDKSRTTQMLNSLSITGVCQRCKDCLEWKIKYKKYKVMTQAKTWYDINETV